MKNPQKVWGAFLWIGSPETKLGELSSQHEDSTKSLGDLPFERKPCNKTWRALISA